LGPPSDTSPDGIAVVVIGLMGDDRIWSGFAWNLVWQLAQQKKYSFPLCCVL
jgi:hypothetical protein